jgi:hypothetical protein
VTNFNFQGIGHHDKNRRVRVLGADLQDERQGHAAYLFTFDKVHSKRGVGACNRFTVAPFYVSTLLHGLSVALADG